MICRLHTDQVRASDTGVECMCTDELAKARVMTSTDDLQHPKWIQTMKMCTQLWKQISLCVYMSMLMQTGRQSRLHLSDCVLHEKAFTKRVIEIGWLTRKMSLCWVPGLAMQARRRHGTACIHNVCLCGLPSCNGDMLEIRNRYPVAFAPCKRLTT